jgi:hypothetical protein
MGRQNIYKTLSVASTLPPSMMDDLVEFLVSNRNFIISDNQKNELFKTRISQHSLIADMVHRLTVVGKNRLYSLLQLPSKTLALREALDLTFIPVDLCQISDASPHTENLVRMFPELNNKLVINITDLTKANGDFSDVTQFHHRVVRDFLVRNFYSSGGNSWISPALVSYVAKVYSMTIGGQISRFFNLSPLTQSFVQTVFCVFYVGLMTSSDIAPTFVKAQGKNLGLNNPNDIVQILSFIDKELGKPVPENLEEVCLMIDALEHGQLRHDGGSRITRPVLNAKFRNLSNDGHMSVIALEYPPYFLFMILLVLSHVRIGLSFSMKNLNLIKEGQTLMDQVMLSPQLFNTM